MKKTVVIKASEQEILDLINKHFGTDEDSIVALQELGNEDWVVSVSKFDHDVRDIIRDGKVMNYCVADALDRLCFDGILEEGEYIIDCTW